MADIAQIGFSADTSELKDAQVSIQALVPAAKNAENASASLAKQFISNDNAARMAANGNIAAANSMKQIASASMPQISALGSAANAINNHTRAIKLNQRETLELIHISRAFSEGILMGVSPMRLLGEESGHLLQVFAKPGGLIELLKTAGLALGLLKFKDAGNGMNALASSASAASTGLALAPVSKNSMAANEMAEGSDAVAMGATTATVATEEFEAAVVGATASFQGATIAAEGLAVSEEGLSVQMAAAAAYLQGASAEMDGVVAASEGVVIANAAIAESAVAAADAEAVALTPLGIIIFSIVGALSVLVALFGVADHQINQATGNIAKGMGLTSDQMEKLEDKGTKLSVTLSDTFKGFFEAIGQTIEKYGSKQLSAIAKIWNAILGDIAFVAVGIIKIVLGIFVGSFDAIKAVWGNLPAVLGDIFYTAANGAISAIDWLINKVVDGVNSLGGHLNKVDLGKVANPFAGAALKTTLSGVKEFIKGYGDAGKGIDEFGKIWSKDAKEFAQDRIAKDAGKPAKTPKGPKTDAEKFADLVTGANNTINEENAKGAAAGMDMTALAAATLEGKTKLLAEAQTKEITLTAAMRTKIDDLAAAYGRAKVAADNAIGLKDVLKASDKDITDAKASVDMIGLYGRQLAYATEMKKLYDDGVSKKMTPDAITAATPQFQNKANAFADASAQAETLKFMEAQRVAAIQGTTALNDQAAAIGLNVAQTNQLQAEQAVLNAAMQAHITLSPQEINALKLQADTMADLKTRTDLATQAYNDLKSGTTSFVETMRSDLEQGKSFWQSFGDAVIKAIDSIITKLIDLSIEQAFAANASSSGGGIAGIIKNIFGVGGGGGSDLSNSIGGPSGNIGGIADITGSANGNIFSNGIVTSPTMFKFAKGTKLGEMGEAGPEAIVPLKRGPDGSLGVQMHGGGSGAPASVNAPVTIINNHYISGAVSSKDIVGMVQQSAENTKQQVKRSIIPWMAQYQRDGTL